MPVKKRKGDAGACDRLWSQIIRGRAPNGRCQRCGAHDRLEAAHIVSRKYTVTRHDLRNGRALCPSCHRAQHDGLFDWPELVDADTLDDLRRLKRDHTPFKAPPGYYQELRAELKDILDELDR